jgi:hypothetical protein
MSDTLDFSIPTPTRKAPTPAPKLAATLDPATPQEGLFYGVSDEVYFALPYLSASVIKQGARCMLHARYALNESVKETKALRMGSMIDTGLFYGEAELARRFAYRPDGIDGRTKEGKVALAAWTEQVRECGARVVPVEEFQESQRIIDAARKHPHLAAILGTTGEAQCVCVWQDSDTGLWCKCKVDRFVPGKIALELKTTVNASPDGFAREAAKHKYIYQFAWYWHGLRKLTGENFPFVVAAVEKGGYCPTSIYTIPEEYMKRALEECKRIGKTIAKCYETGKWSGYSDTVTSLELPPYAFDTSYVYSPDDSDSNEHPF